MKSLSSDLLRTFLAIADTGSMTDGAARVFRSQSAASLQVKKLEAILCRPVFRRHGRGVELTSIGERLLPVARNVTRTLDSALRDLSADNLEGKLRVGIPEEYSQDRLARIVGEFAQSHPLVELQVTCAAGSRFPDALEAGTLDVAIFESDRTMAGQEVLAREKTFWMTSRHHDLISMDILPVALFDIDCWWREVALAELRRRGRDYRIAYSSHSVAGVAAAIEAGIAVGLLGESSLVDNMAVLGPESGFAKMPVSKLVLATAAGAGNPPLRALQDAIRHAYRTP